jgi:hypothetical protein
MISKKHIDIFPAFRVNRQLDIMAIITKLRQSESMDNQTVNVMSIFPNQECHSHFYVNQNVQVFQQTLRNKQVCTS